MPSFIWGRMSLMVKNIICRFDSYKRQKKMTKFFIVADVHSFYIQLIKALKKAGFNKDNEDHIFVSCGDLLDRGPDPIACLEFVNSLPPERKILIRGNHEALFEQCASRKFFQDHDYHNGTVETIKTLANVPRYPQELPDYEIIKKASDNPLWKEYIASCVDYYEDDEDIFVHGWIPYNIDKEHAYSYNPEWRQEKDWHDAIWANGMACWEDGVRENNKTIYCGHFHASWGHHYLHDDGPEWDDYVSLLFGAGKAKFTPFEDTGICCLDACTAYSDFINCKVIKKMKKPIKENYHRVLEE